MRHSIIAWHRRARYRALLFRRCTQRYLPNGFPPRPQENLSSERSRKDKKLPETVPRRFLRHSSLLHLQIASPDLQSGRSSRDPNHRPIRAGRRRAPFPCSAHRRSRSECAATHFQRFAVAHWDHSQAVALWWKSRRQLLHKGPARRTIKSVRT